MKNRRGITLVALVITMIVLIILAGISINLILGENGILKRAKIAKEEYEDAKKNEEIDLEKLYSSIKVAGDSKVTLTMEELDNHINKKVEEKMKNNFKSGMINFGIVDSKNTSYIDVNFNTPFENDEYSVLFTITSGGSSWSYINIRVHNKTKNGFRAYAYNNAENNTGAQITANWVAVPYNN